MRHTTEELDRKKMLEREEQIREAMLDIRNKAQEVRDRGVTLRQGDKIIVALRGKRQRGTFTIVKHTDIYILAQGKGGYVEIFLELGDMK